jgi:hypothetical protein
VNGGDTQDLKSVGTTAVPEETAKNGGDTEPIGTTGVPEEAAKSGDEAAKSGGEAAKSGGEIESIGTTGVPETAKNRGEIESVGTTGVPEKSVENGGTTGVPEKTVENGGITRVPEKTIEDGGEIPVLMAREEMIVDNNVDRNAGGQEASNTHGHDGTTSEMVGEQEALDTNGHEATTGDAAQHGFTAPATLGTMVLSGFMAPMTFGTTMDGEPGAPSVTYSSTTVVLQEVAQMKESGGNEAAHNDESGGSEVARNDETGGSKVARDDNAQRVVVEHKAARRCTNEIVLEAPKWQDFAATDIEVDAGQLAICMWVDDPNDTWWIDHDDISPHVIPNNADGGKAMKDRAMKAMNNAPKYQGSSNEAMNDAPINKQHDDSKQDGCTIASKDEIQRSG